MKKVAYGSVVAICLLLIGCDKGNPNRPSPVDMDTHPQPPVVEPTEITITVVAPYIKWSDYHPQNPGISEVTVTCTVGCDGQQTEMTDSQGTVTFTGWVPLTIRTERKLGYIPAKQMVRDGDLVILGHEWPPESAASFRRLQPLPPDLVLNWNEDDVTVQGGYWGEYNCSIILVRRRTDRRVMLNVLEHELRHARQDETISSGRCSDVRKEWHKTPDGREWMAATDADLAAKRFVLELDDGGYFSQFPSELEAEFYAHWVRARWPLTGQYDICFNGKSERCKYFEAHHGPRPSSYP